MWFSVALKAQHQGASREPSHCPCSFVGTCPSFSCSPAPEPSPSSALLPPGPSLAQRGSSPEKLPSHSQAAPAPHDHPLLVPPAQTVTTDGSHPANMCWIKALLPSLKCRVLEGKCSLFRGISMSHIVPCIQKACRGFLEICTELLDP